jgi:hypothetical protein
VDISSGEEPPCQKDSASEVAKEMEVPVSALVTLRDPDQSALEGPTALIDAPVTPQGLQKPVVAASVISSSLERPAVALTTANLPSKGVCLQEPTAASLAVAPPSERVNPREPTFAPPAVDVPPPEGTRLQEPIGSSTAVTTPSQDRYVLPPDHFCLFVCCSTHMLPFRA